MPRKKVRCARCVRRLKYPIWVNEQPYGKVCATKIKKMIPQPDYHEEIKSLKLQVRELQAEIQNLKMNGQIPIPVAAPLTDPTIPVGMNYGCDHGALMNELKSVLKERVCA